MGVLIGHASIDERGSARGGAAGDQTGREVRRFQRSKPYKFHVGRSENRIQGKLTKERQAMYSKSMRSLRITTKEAEKVRHDINDDWHAKYQNNCGEVCVIETHSHKSDSPGFAYYFINNDFDCYRFIAKYRID